MNIIFEDKDGVRTELKGGGNEVHLYLHNVSFTADFDNGFDISLKILNSSSSRITTWEEIRDYVMDVCNGVLPCCGKNPKGYYPLAFHCTQGAGPDCSGVAVVATSKLSSGGQGYVVISLTNYFYSEDCININDAVTQIL